MLIDRSAEALAEGGVGQNQRTGEIIGQTDTGETARFFVSQRTRGYEGVDGLALFEKGKLRRHLERLMPRVYFEEWDEPMITGIGWVSELIEIAGGVDVFSDLSNHNPPRTGS